MTHAIIYDRASTKLQKDNYSRVNAREVGIRRAEQYGFTWEYVKEIGSGTTLTGRPEMMKILDRIAAGEIQIIIVQDLDRLARPEDAIVYNTIRQVIMEYNVMIHPHVGPPIDLNNDDDDFVADITMSVAKKERRRIVKRIKRSIRAKAEEGRYVGGVPGLGYKLTYRDGKDGDLVIDENEAETVKAVFKFLQETGGNLGATAKKLNELGYTGKKGRKFAPSTVRWIVNRKLYVGILETEITDKISLRPDLRIISLTQFERVHELIRSRAGKSKDMGRRGHYIFTGFVVCGTCNGPMVAANRKGGSVVYQCANQRKHGKTACSCGKNYAEHLILPPVIEFLTEFIQNHPFYNALDAAAARYGKSVTEEAIEAAISGELASIQAGKQRLVEAISLGVLSNQEAAAKLAELRAHEQRLTVELSSITEKAAILAEWQAAIELLRGQDIKSQLKKLAEDFPISFRRLLSLVFEPNSLRVRTERRGRKWFGVLESYQLTETMQTMMSLSFGKETTGLV